jgi:predicted metal-dependent hydrolase
MVTQFEIAGIAVDVAFKKIKNVHLSVNPPSGAVRIAAPERMKLDTIRVFAISKLGWIKKQQRKLQAQERETPREFLERESHYVWGKRYLLKVMETDRKPSVELKHRTLVLHIRPGADEAARRAIIDEWYRGLVKEAAHPMIAKWEPILNVAVNKVFVQRMKTKWGSCAAASGNIRLNTDLAKKPIDCLEYIVVHEMAHLLEQTHNARFIALMDTFMPNWRFQRELLNKLPVRQEAWGY